MKTNFITSAIVFFSILFGSTFTYSQATSQPTIAVATPSVQGLTITPKICTKIMYLELIKLNQFSVYDEFDISEVVNSTPAFQKECYGLNCLANLGKELNVNYVVSGSIDRLGNKIIISLKIVDVPTASIYKTTIREFANQEDELQRMIEITLHALLGLENDKDVELQLSFKNDVITSKSVGKINNSGPRVGYAVLTGSLNEFAFRPEDQGGLGVFPGFSMIGYQFEKQYIGTDNFSGLFEFIPNVTGLEQGLFLPSVSIMNGFRFGKSGWEFAFGPSFGLSRTSRGFFDNNNLYGKGAGYYWTENEYNNLMSLTLPTPETPIPAPAYSLAHHLDARGTTNLSTRWVMGVGRTFRSGALYIPVNLFYSSTKGGGMVGLNIGFNVVKKKESIYNSGYRY